MRWAAVAVAFTFLASGPFFLAVSLWERFPVVEFDNRTASLLVRREMRFSYVHQTIPVVRVAGFGRTHPDSRNDRLIHGFSSIRGQTE